MFLQKLFRGYADNEVWDFGWHLCKWVRPRLKHLIENHNGFPHKYEQLGSEEVANKAYTDALKEMLWFVELVMCDDWKEMDHEKERMLTAEKLCGENIFYLWD
jgi:hypothetical protein